MCILPQFPVSAFCPINLHQDHISLATPVELATYIEQSKKDQNASVGFGGYLEPRSIYTSDLFALEAEKRTIHLGVDFWTEAGTIVHAPADGVVHSYAYNEQPLDYGGTIILKHELENETIYTLYGHLSKESLDGIKKGQVIYKEMAFAEFGIPEENGGWHPHLHFQVIRDMGDYQGDFPGVCRLSEIDFYKNLCPNPIDFFPSLPS